MTRRDWEAAEREFNRRGEGMGFGRWTRWGQDRRFFSIEFGHVLRFDVSAVGEPPNYRASGRDGDLGMFPTWEAAALACEAEARRIIEGEGADMLTRDHWATYEGLRNKTASRVQHSRRR